MPAKKWPIYKKLLRVLHEKRNKQLEKFGNFNKIFEFELSNKGSYTIANTIAQVNTSFRLILDYISLNL